MRLGVHIPAWRRHRLLGVVLTQLANCREALAPEGIEIVVSVSGSDDWGDPGIMWSLRYHDVVYTDVANKPLGAKVNAAVQALQPMDVDAAIGLGSDDLAHPNLFRAWAQRLDDYDYLGVIDGYFYDVPYRRLVYWPGYHEKHRLNATLGMGRCLSRHALNRLNWQPFPTGSNRCLDKGMGERMDRACYGEREWKGYMRDINAPMVDCKTLEGGLNPMPEGQEIDEGLMELWFGQDIVEELNKC
jgi:hypothetical protein